MKGGVLVRGRFFLLVLGVVIGIYTERFIGKIIAARVGEENALSLLIEGIVVLIFALAAILLLRDKRRL